MRPARVAVCLFAVACVSDPADLEQQDFAIVGGGLETGYAPVGYMSVDSYAPFCGATLVRPDLAVTAAHCVVGGTTFGIGFGQVSSSPIHPAQRVLVQPGYDQAANSGGGKDLALLVLTNPVPGITPARITDPSIGCSFRSVGYGRTITSADPMTSQGYTNERKSMRLCVDSMDIDPNNTPDPGILLITGTDGGLCYGDSGGAMLVEGTTNIVAVHSYIFDASCPSAGQGGVTSIAEWLPWIEQEVGRDPTVQLAKPAAGATVGTGFVIEVQADDDLRLQSVEVTVDGTVVGTGQAPPFSYTAPATLGNGPHVVEARAVDHSGKMAVATANVNVSAGADPDPDPEPDPGGGEGGGEGEGETGTGEGPPVITGGCAVGGASGRGGVGLVALAGAALLLLGRRRRVLRTSSCDPYASSR